MVIHMAIKGEKIQKQTHCQARLENTSLMCKLDRMETEWRDRPESVAENRAYLSTCLLYGCALFYP